MAVTITMAQGSTDPDHPNVLLVIADDLGVDPIPGYPGNGIKAHMPHLEEMMAEGLTFDNFWSQPIRQSYGSS